VAFVLASLSLSAVILYAAFKRLTNFWLLLAVTSILFIGIEFALRIGTTKYLNYFELLHGRYASYYGIYTEPVLHYKANDTLHISSRGEFSFAFTTNQMGYADREWPDDTIVDTYKILCMGDSFTLGVGAPQDSGWVGSFRQCLLKQGINAQTYNTGITGSDIVNEFQKLRTRFSGKQFDAVVLCLNASDLVEIYLRGGRERFTEKRTPAQNPLKKSEWLYEILFCYRLYVHECLGLNFLFLTKAEAQREDAKAVNIMREHILDFRQYCLENELSFYFFLHPHSFEMLNQQYMSPVFSTLLTNFEDIGDDFMKEMSQVIKKGQHYSEFYYERDRHFTTEGYRILGQLAANGFVEKMEKGKLGKNTNP